MDNGKIKQNREFTNSYNQMGALGIPVPNIKRKGLEYDFQLKIG